MQSPITAVIISAPRPAALVAPSLDPTERLLDTQPGRVVEARAGDLCSLLGIAGAATIALTHRSPAIEHIGDRIVMGSMIAAGADTTIQARNVLVDDGRGAQARGAARSDPGTIAYAATGMIPAASLAALSGLHRHPSRQEVAGLALVGVNGAMLGFELVTRGPDMARGEESISGYGSALASLGGFVVAHHVAGR